MRHAFRVPEWDSLDENLMFSRLPLRLHVTARERRHMLRQTQVTRPGALRLFTEDPAPDAQTRCQGSPPPARKVFAAAFRPASAHAEETRKWPPTSNVACCQVPSLVPPKVIRPGCLQQPPRPDTLPQPLRTHLLFQSLVPDKLLWQNLTKDPIDLLP